MRKTNLVVLSGAGISAESGLKTFRDSDGLWEGFNVYDVATPEAWQRNPTLVQDFYNMRRKDILAASPNRAHAIIADLQRYYHVTVITQNIDNLHERAGSKDVVHLHGIITRSQSSYNPALTYEIGGWELKMGDKCERGSQLRPHVVWFGEAVPMMEKAAKICQTADIFLIVGTSLQVYPAANLVDYVPAVAEKYLVDPKAESLAGVRGVHLIKERATEGLARLFEMFRSRHADK